MNKYDIKIKNNDIFSLYFNTDKEIYDYCNKYLPEVKKEDISIDNDLEYLKYIEEIINNSEETIILKGKKHYLYKTSNGLIPVYLYKDKEFYLDGLSYIEVLYNKLNNKLILSKNNYVYFPMSVSSTPQRFLNKFRPKNQIKFSIYSFRKYGEPKLSKPKELKGIKQSFSINYNKHCKCPVFIKDNDIWIKHKDYFSPSVNSKDNEDLGASLDFLTKKYLNKDKKQKFIYGDSWGDIVLRQEAYICIKNLLKHIKEDFELDIINKIIKQQEKIHKFKKYELEDTNMSRFWEKVINKLKIEEC